MNNFIETVVNHDKNDYINKRHLLVCDNCCWCLSYLPDLENNRVQHFGKCPNCHQNLRRMYISEKAAHRFDNKGSQEMSEYELLVA